jgi:ankyrin repeat protein
MTSDADSCVLQLRLAAAYGHIDVVRLLVNKSGSNSRTIDEAMCDAAEHGHIAIVEMLIDDFGANVHARKDAALQSASLYGRVPLVSMLLDRGTDVHANGDAALQNAAAVGPATTIRTLLDAGADVHASGALDQAINGENMDAVHVLIEYGASTTSHPLMLRRMLLQDIPEMAASCRDEELVLAVDAGYHWSHRALALLRLGADVHTRNDAALRIASQDGNTVVVRELIQRGADVHANDDEALRTARNEDIVRLLLDAGANVHACDDEALRSAARYNETEIVYRRPPRTSVDR